MCERDVCSTPSEARDRIVSRVLGINKGLMARATSLMDWSIGGGDSRICRLQVVMTDMDLMWSTLVSSER